MNTLGWVLISSATTVVILVISVMSLKLYVKLTTGWCRSNVCLVGKTAVITGANAGIGYHTAEDFAKRGARVILACRDPSRAQSAAEKIIKATENKNVVVKLIDLSSFKSIRQFVTDFIANEERIDILVNNAGLGSTGTEKTEDGNLVTMQANYFGHFLLTNLLLDLLRKTPNSRIVNVSSIGATWARSFDANNLNDYPNLMASDLALYARSKLCQVLFTIELARRLEGTTVTTYSLHPGAVYTEIFKNMQSWTRVLWEQTIKWFFKSPIEGAQTSIYCSVAKGIESLSGEHFEDCHVVKRYSTARNPDAPGKLWKVSEKICEITPTSK